jgi:hypothetical protein
MAQLRRMTTLRILLVTLAVLVVVVGFLWWFFPATSYTAFSIAKDKEVYQSPGTEYGRLIALYEEATGIKGSWQLRSARDDHWWAEVTYTHPGFDGMLWFGVKGRWMGTYMNDLSPATTTEMIETIAGR